MALFNFATDFKVELYEGIDGIFKLGISELGGSDVLGDGYQYTNVTDSLVDVQIQEGVTLIPGATEYDEPNIQIRLSGTQYDPTFNQSVRINSPIKISAKDSSGVWHIIYHARIAAITSIFDSDMSDSPNQNIVTFTLTNPVAIAMSTNVEELTLNNDEYSSYRMVRLMTEARKKNTYLPTLQFRNLHGDTFTPTLSDWEPSWGLVVVAGDYVGDYPLYGETIGTAFNQCVEIAGGLQGWVTADRNNTDPNGVLVWMTNEGTTLTPYTPSFTLDNQSIGVQISNVDLSQNYAETINSWNVAYSWDETDVYSESNQDSIDLYGLTSQEKSLNFTTTDVSIYDRRPGWVSTSRSQDGNLKINSVTASCVNNSDGQLNDLAFAQAGITLISFKFDSGSFSIDKQMVITKINHQINSNSWITDVELQEVVYG